MTACPNIWRMAGVLLLVAAWPAAGDIVVTVQPSETVVEVGDYFTVDLLADIPLADAIVGWGMDLSFDGSILSHDPLVDVAIGPAFIPALAPDGDKLAGLFFGPPPPPPGLSGDDVLLATMTFEALMPGSTSLNGGITLGDPSEGFIGPGLPAPVRTVLFSDASVTVIPAPAGVVLGLIGLGVVGWVKRRVG